MTRFVTMATHVVDDYMKNPVWIARIKGHFDFIDSNKNGTVEVSDWMRYVDNINREVKPDIKLYENLRQAMLNSIADVGVTPGKKLTKDEFVKNMAELAVKENAKRSKGETSYFKELLNAWYDVVDTSHDGFLTLNEYKSILKAFNFTAEEAEASFYKLMGTNKNAGKIERKALIDHEYKYWFSLSEDKAIEGMLLWSQLSSHAEL